MRHMLEFDRDRTYDELLDQFTHISFCLSNSLGNFVFLLELGEPP